MPVAPALIQGNAKMLTSIFGGNYALLFVQNGREQSWQQYRKATEKNRQQLRYALTLLYNSLKMLT